MSHHQPTVKEAERIIEVAGERFDEWDLEVREDYSGRAMYGDTCVAIVGDQYTDDRVLFLSIGYLVGTNELPEKAGGWFTRSDNMGMGWVRY